ncbi:hypothetical protein LHYA1_G006288 [Lachnellula hyalina]|uniref:Mucin n=1 Tax=Lachnellula hyalina TaxID=1316788 RepID=A0A8H8QXJ7_9HELO|nr:uncharacterized protein LHYA1_G006288 [Lachnellula hyalina]TVY24584.1 hypothetical protein LHYA1_G006288 [Lachnellula hyalina]
MAPMRPSGRGRLEGLHSLDPIYTSSVSLSSSSSDPNSTALTPRTLYAQTFDRPSSSRSLPSTQYRKNMKEFTGFETTEAEFDALPLAVRRKVCSTIFLTEWGNGRESGEKVVRTIMLERVSYFSTLERLRFAQNSRTNALNELPIQRTRKGSIADRRGLNTPMISPPRKPSGRLRKPAKQHSVTSSEASWFLTLPDKIKKQHFTREEQVVLAGRLRESVILDAADESVYKAKQRQLNRSLTVPSASTTPTTPITPGSSGSSRRSQDTKSSMAAAMFDSFRWMDEESDLDLRLVLDDYHANLDGCPSPTSARRPSFRRQMSISKRPFGKGSLPSLQHHSPRPPPPPQSSHSSHNRQQSRALSLIQPKHVPQSSVSSIDPNAKHYQDPEARLKLRVYLASPQKFDEAIEFGFPALDGTDKENNPPRRMSKEQALKGRSSKDAAGFKSSFATDGGISFLDDTASLFDDDVSMPDLDSPITPQGPDIVYRPPPRTSTSAYAYSGAKSSKTSADYSHLGITKPTVVKPQDGYTQAMAGSREMTMRMTLTRPDLRADETTLYGWQMTKAPLKEADLPMEDDMDEKLESRGPFGGPDGWGHSEKEDGVVKRFWNRVKSSQRKAT